MEFPLPGELEMIIHSGRTGPALPGLRRADSVTTRSWGAVLHPTVPYGTVLLWRWVSGEGEEEEASIQGRQPQPRACVLMGMHRASFVGQIRIRLLPDPLEQSLEALRWACPRPERRKINLAGK